MDTLALASFDFALALDRFRPEPRFDTTRELTLADILTTEGEAARDAANLQAAREFIAECN